PGGAASPAFGGPGGPFGGGGLAALLAAQQQTPTKEKIRVVADPATNSIIVKAKLVDLMTIRRLIKEIDVVHTDQDHARVTNVIGPLKHAHADDVAVILRDVYRTALANQNAGGITAVSGGVGGGRGFGGGPFGQTAVVSTGGPLEVQLSVGVDNQTNSIIVQCPQPLFADVKTLVEQLDEA